MNERIKKLFNKDNLWKRKSKKEYLKLTKDKLFATLILRIASYDRLRNKYARQSLENDFLNRKNLQRIKSCPRSQSRYFYFFLFFWIMFFTYLH